MTGTLINYYFVCKRKCWLFYQKINLEDNSEEVRIGKVLHMLEENKNSEILIEDIKIDKSTKKYIVEYKKSDSNIDADYYQVLNYLIKLKDKGIERKGKISFFEKERQNCKEIIVELNEENIKKYEEKVKEINSLLEKPFPPKFSKNKNCTKCAYRDYCML